MWLTLTQAKTEPSYVADLTQAKTEPSYVADPDMALAKIVSCVFSLSILVIVVKGVHRNLQVGHCSYLFETDVQREQFPTVKKQVEKFCHVLFTQIAWPSLTCFQHTLHSQKLYMH